MKPTSSTLLAVALAFGAAFASVVLALSPALALADDGFAAARGRYELSDARVVHLGGTPRRPVLTGDDGNEIVLSPLKAGVATSADGRVALRLTSEPNGVVTGLTLTLRGPRP